MPVGSSTHRRLRAVPGVNLTPMLDILFNLIFFLMLTTTLRDETRVMEIQLPTTSRSAATDSLPQLKSLEVDAENMVYLDGRMLMTAEISQELQALARDGVKRVVIRADERADWGTLYRLLEACFEAGLDPLPESELPRPAP